MLSTSVIKNVSGAAHYYAAKDNYYTREEGHRQSEWYGSGAEKLGLSGMADAGQFTRLLEGRLPNGEQIGKVVDGQVIHRSGWDLTFSAPKSVSVLALIGGDARLIEAHRQAVYAALSEVEKVCSEVRVKSGGAVAYQRTGNITAALYHHDLSRARDPQLHTHSVVMNLTQRSDGQWRSMASKMGRYDGEVQEGVHGFIERVRNNKRYFGKLYEAELAFRVREIGYEIIVDRHKSEKGENTSFEISGVSKDVIRHFSKRRVQIQKALQESGFTGEKAAEIAGLNTRENKKHVDRSDLSAEWRQQAEALGLDCSSLIQKASGRTLDNSAPQLNPGASIAVGQAAHQLSRLKTIFALEELVTSALDHVAGDPVRPDTIIQSIKLATQAGDLIVFDNESGKTLFMTKQTLSDENRLYAQLGGQAHDSKIPESRLKTLSDRHAMDPEITGALGVLFGKNRILLMEGQDLQERLLEPAIRTARDAGLEVAVLSGSPSGSRDLAYSMKPHSFKHRLQTMLFGHDIRHYSTMQFLIGKGERPEPDMLFVDKANLLSTWQLAELSEWSARHDGRLILMGDRRTLLSQQTGVSLDNLIAHGITKISLGDTGRKAGQDRVQMVQVADMDDRHRAMASHYGRLGKQERQRAYLATHQKKSVEVLNCLVHSEIKQQSDGRVVHADLLVPVFVPETQQNNATAYPANHVVRFNEDLSSVSIRRGDYLKVVSNDRKLNRVLLQKNNGRTVFWYPGRDHVASDKHRPAELFAEKSCELVCGEQVAFTRSLPGRNILKGDRMTVSALSRLNRKMLTLKGEDGRTVTLDLNRPAHRHFDYGYAGTLHSLAHTKPYVLISEFPVRSFSTTQRHYQQVVTQPERTWIYTDNISSFCKSVEKNTGDRLSAHETLKQVEENAKGLRTLAGVINQYLPTGSPMEAVNAVEYALHHLAEREAGFTHRQVIEMAVFKAMGTVRPDQLTQAMMAAEKAGVLVRGRGSDGTLWTTLDAMRMEQEIVALARDASGKGRLPSLANIDEIRTHCANASLKSEQAEAVRAILQSRDRIIAIQGYAGTGKTTMLETVSEVLKSADSLLSSESGSGAARHQLLGLAPTNRAVAELKKRGIPAQTIDSFLNTIRHEKDIGNVTDRRHLVLVVDESSMVSNRKARDILQTVHDLDCRAVMVGDIRQLPAVESGKPFALIQSCVETTRLTDIRRQKDTTLIEAVDQVIRKDFQKAFVTLKQSIVEVNENTHALSARDAEGKRAEARAMRIDLMARDFLSYPKAERGNVQIITPGHDDRMLMNQRVRELMKEMGEGGLAMNADTACQILRPASLTQRERSESTSFRQGQVLRFAVTQPCGIRAGEYLTVGAINHTDRMLILQKADGSTHLWEIPTFSVKRRSDIEVFKPESRGLQPGDMIRWTRSDRKNGLFATEPAEIVSMTGGTVTAKLASGEFFTFDAKDRHFQHWDHGYAATAHAVQGDTKSVVLAHMESWRANLSTQPAFLVALTRSVHQFRLYTDDAGRLLESIMAKSGTKLSSLQVAGQYPSVSKKSERTGSIQKAVLKSHKPDRETVRRIGDFLNTNSAEIAINMLGEPRAKGPNFMKFGRHQGSLCVTTRGEKQGWWHDFSEQQGGRGMLSFLQKQGGMSRQKALEYGARLAGIVWSDNASKPPFQPMGGNAVTPKDRAVTERDMTKSLHRRITYARKLAAESVPVQGTLAEKYLQTHRGIDLKKWPDSVRFHPGIYSSLNRKTLPALIVVATDAKGDIQAVQATWLDPDTAAKINKSDVKAPKQTFGILKGSSVQLGNPQAKTALIAEGTETGLSLLKAIPDASVRVTLGKANLCQDPYSLPKNVVLCLDNDGKKPESDPAIRKTIRHIHSPSRSLKIMIPGAETGHKWDYNDVLLEKGPASIRRDFNESISPESILAGASGSGDSFTPSIEHGIQKVAREIGKSTRHHVLPSPHQERSGTLLEREI